MTVNLQVFGDGSTGLVGISGAATPDTYMKTQALSSSTVSSTSFTAPRAMKLTSLTYRPDVAGTDASAVTFVINKCASGTAPAGGTIVHSGTGNLKGAANTNQSLTLLTTTAVNLAAGDSLCIVPTGVLTSVVGSLTLGFVYL